MRAIPLPTLHALQVELDTVLRVGLGRQVSEVPPREQAHWASILESRKIPGENRKLLSLRIVLHVVGQCIQDVHHALQGIRHSTCGLTTNEYERLSFRCKRHVGWCRHALLDLQEVKISSATFGILGHDIVAPLARHDWVEGAREDALDLFAQKRPFESFTLGDGGTFNTFAALAEGDWRKLTIDWFRGQLDRGFAWWLARWLSRRHRQLAFALWRTWRSVGLLHCAEGVV
jgi:hypothetical protein